MNKVAKFLAAAALLGVVAWIGAYFYWHFRLLGAVRTLETRMGTPSANDAHDVIEAGGCRALPYLVGALEHTKNPLFLIYATGEIVKSIEARAGPALASQARDWRIVPEDSPPEMKAKCDALQDYWKANERLHHQWWRIWSSSCPP